MVFEQGSSRITLAEYMALPEGHYNLIDGVLIVTPAASPRHQTLVARILTELTVFVRLRKLGAVWAAPLDVFLREAEPAIVVQPDVLFLAKDGAAKLGRRGVSGPPDLVVEVVSPGNPRLDTIKKREIYDAYGVREYWMVLPDLDQVEVLRRGPEGAFGRPILLDVGDVLTCSALPGFELALRELFAPEDIAYDEEGSRDGR